MTDSGGCNAGRPAWNRRRVLKAIGVAGAALAIDPFVLAACGDDNDKSDTSKPNRTAAASNDTGHQLAELLQIDPATAGQGITFEVGAVLALTGSGSFYGKTMTRGIDLAVEHIKAAGGPSFAVKYYDHKSGDPAAGRQAVVELGEAGYPAKLASYADDLGAMLAGTAQYKVFTFDGGGGTDQRPRASRSSGAPGRSLPTTPDAGLVQVDWKGGLPGRQDGRRRAVGTSGGRQQRGTKQKDVVRLKIEAGG